MTDLWSRFRHFPLWLQVVVWAVLWPIPLGLWAAARPHGRRRGPAVLAVASAMVWIAIPLSSSSSRGPEDRLVAGGQAAPAPASTGGSSTPATTAALGTAGGPSDSVGSSPAASGPTATASGPAAPATGSTVKKPPAGSPSSTATTATTRPAQPSSGDPTAVLNGLRVAPEGARAGYQRDLFKHWVDGDGDGCDTRDEVLIAESRSKAQVDPYGCKVVAGDWFSWYDGLTFSDPAELDIDHMVPLAEAWDSGASAWDAARRERFANDLDHPEALAAVSASSNRSKGDLDPGQWKPTRDAAWCRYANDWVTVKKAWDLSADQTEVDDLRVMLRTCSGGSPASSSTTTTTVTTAQPSGGGGGGVVISALDCQGERVTVHNGGGAPADLTGWSIHDEASTPHTYKFPAGYTLAPGASVTIRSGGPASSAELAWTSSNIWNNDGDTATLVNAAGSAVSTKSC